MLSSTPVYKPDRLLILDDDALTGQTILNMARIAGIEAQFTDMPDEFFRLVQSWQPDFIAIDLIMPRMDGVQVLIELAKLDCQAEIIISSGVGGRVLDAAARSASEHGLKLLGVLAKPFSPAKLRGILRRGIPPATTEDAPAPPSNNAPYVPSKEELMAALQRREIHVAYQPKINCRTRLLAGFEALARWRHVEHGLIPPDTFIPLAEQSGLIDPLTEYIVAEALTWLAALPGQFATLPEHPYLARRLNEVSLAINISNRSLSNLTLFEKLEELCYATGVTPQRLILELTESCATEDPVTALDVLTRLRMKGFQVSIDDFGTGYSSMVQLARLPFSEIKIDKSFVTTLSQHKESRTVVKAIIDLGHGLGLYTAAEGIENFDTLEYLRSIGCDLAQGYAIKEPLDAEGIHEWLSSQHRDDEQHRLGVLHSLGLLDTPSDERFDRITRLATRLFNVPISLFSLVDENRQWFKSHTGIDVRETPREHSFCSHAIQSDQVMVVEDTWLDPRFQNNALVTSTPHIRFYAGSPVRVGMGSRLGTLCLIAEQPGTLDDKGRTLLKNMSVMIESELAGDYLAHIDPMTRLLNRRGFDARCDDVIGICNSAGLHACLFLIDLIDLKRFNQEHGPAAGDRALREFARLLGRVFRGSDLSARYGDDDFVVLLIDATPPGPERALSRFHHAAQSLYQRIPIHYQVGWTMLEPGDNMQQLVARASQRMHAHNETA
ncbi:MAG TPA: diguanylate cyclase [Pseudohongiella sp.]|nr:diguanylate cyclase [Pseudohongiella sp.]HBX36441.1 diguanylate cyclase [Pseudohongiella sp.]|tara:strand:- start:4637 stop:6802 length:2166 start_codon:yes stop_codon:yes gene_type:complete